MESKALDNCTPGLYRGTKELKAWPMTRGEYLGYRGLELSEGEDAADNGYLVEYLDGGKANDPRHSGYISWSPSDVFDRTYYPTDGADQAAAGVPDDSWRERENRMFALDKAVVYAAARPSLYDASGVAGAAAIFYDFLTGVPYPGTPTASASDQA